MRLFAVLHKNHLLLILAQISHGKRSYFLVFLRRLMTVLSAKLVLTHSDTASKTSLYIEKLRKYSALFAIGILRLHLEMDISYLCKTEKEINNIVVGDKIIK